MSTTEFKVVLVGEGSVGKTTLVKRHMTGEFDTKYTATVGVEVHPLRFHTNVGPVTLNVWDCSGQEKFGGLRQGYYAQADAAILMFSLDSNLSLKGISAYYRELKDVPKVLVGNKCDVKCSVATSNLLMVREFMGCEYYPISTKSNYGYEKPFLSLIRLLMKDDTIHFIEHLFLPEPVVIVPVPVPVVVKKEECTTHTQIEISNGVITIDIEAQSKDAKLLCAKLREIIDTFEVNL